MFWMICCHKANGSESLPKKSIFEATYQEQLNWVKFQNCNWNFAPVKVIFGRAAHSIFGVREGTYSTIFRKSFLFHVRYTLEAGLEPRPTVRQYAPQTTRLSR